MTPRELAKSQGRLHLHPVEASLWHERADVEHQLRSWGVPTSMSLIVNIIVTRLEPDLQIEAVRTIFRLYAEAIVPLESMQDFIIGLCHEKSFDGKKAMTKLLRACVVLAQEVDRRLLEGRVGRVVLHQALVNRADDLIEVLGIVPGSLEPTADLMVALADGATIDGFKWVIAYETWAAEQKLRFTELFMDCCVRLHPSNERYQAVLKHLWSNGLPAGFELQASDIKSKACVRAAVLECKIAVPEGLVRQAPPSFRLSMALAGLATTQGAKVPQRLVQNKLEIDLGL